jgi:hypothetical protein
MNKKAPQHLPVNVFAATHEMLKDWYLEPDTKDKDKQVLVVRQVKFEGETAIVKCIRLPQDQWNGLVEELQKILKIEGPIAEGTASNAPDILRHQDPWRDDAPAKLPDSWYSKPDVS